MARAPLLLIIDDEPANHAIAGTILAADGWQVDRADTGAAGIAIARNRRYSLILIDIQKPGLAGIEATRAIRSGSGASRAAPILAVTARQDAGRAQPLHAFGIDGHVAEPFTPDELRAAVAPWRPDDEPLVSARLAAVFGAAEIAMLIEGLRAQLEDALACGDDDATRRGRAHRLAGLAGTLGFPALSASWLAASEGDDTAYRLARINARKVLARISAVDP